ncbi:MAG: alpha/beta hydrolase [Burkholderiales bacterium]
MHIYRGMDRAALDAAYNNSAAVAESARFLTDWDRRSAALAAARPRFLDLRYGRRERNRIDYFPAAAAGAPVLAFIHGGYWQMRAKETFRFVAEGPLAHGVSVALVAYTLAPDATLTAIVGEVQTALTWLQENVERLGGDARRIYASGWSAGGHLTAMSISHPAVRGGLAVSGIFDLEPIRLSYINEKLNLTDDEVQRLSPLRNMPRASPPLVVAYGTGELPELQRQSCEYGAALAQAGVNVTLAGLANHNHFSILEELASARGRLTELALELLAS